MPLIHGTDSARSHTVLHGIQRTAATVVINRDGPNPQVMRPTAGNQWAAINGSWLAPDYLWNCDEASGNLVDKRQDAALIPAGTVEYQVTGPTGWTGKFVRHQQVAGSCFQAPLGACWNTSSQSVVWVGYFKLTASGGTRTLYLLSGSNLIVQTIATSKFIFGRTGSTVTGNVAYNDSVVHPIVVEYIGGDGMTGHSGAGLLRCSTDKEQLTVTWGQVGDNTKGVGINGAPAPPDAMHGMFAAWIGTAAEQLSTYGPKTMIQDLGWTVTGY